MVKTVGSESIALESRYGYIFKVSMVVSYTAAIDRKAANV